MATDGVTAAAAAGARTLVSLLIERDLAAAKRQRCRLAYDKADGELARLEGAVLAVMRDAKVAQVGFGGLLYRRGRTALIVEALPYAGEIPLPPAGDGEPTDAEVADLVGELKRRNRNELDGVLARAWRPDEVPGDFDDGVAFPEPGPVS